MSEWWTYTLSDFLLFSPKAYYRLFELYNQEVWPAQLVALPLGVATLALMRGKGTGQARRVAAILATCWLWIAWAYHQHRYATINWAASYFAAAFAIEALLLIVSGVARAGTTAPSAPAPAKAVGAGMMLFALVAYPSIGLLLGRPWTQVELFGIAPDPTAIATLGVVLAADRMRWHLLLIPALWCALSGATLWTMGSPDFAVTPLMAVLAIVVTAWRRFAPPRTGPDPQT